MQRPIMPVTGYVRADVQANRATIVATYVELDRVSQEAIAKTTRRVQGLGVVVTELGADKVRVTTNLRSRPIYDQYRDREGNMVSYDTPDRIDTYEATATVSIEVRDMAVLQRVYAMLIASRPNNTGQVQFAMEPTNENLTEMFDRAAQDARRRAEAAAKAAGAALGPVRLIDPTGAACQTLGYGIGTTSGAGASGNAGGYGVQSINLRNMGSGRTLLSAPQVTGGPMQNAAAIPTDVLAQIEVLRDAGANADLGLALQPPIVELREQVCVVYSLG